MLSRASKSAYDKNLDKGHLLNFHVGHERGQNRNGRVLSNFDVALLLYWRPGDELTIGKTRDFCTPCCFAGVNMKVRKAPHLQAKIELHCDTIIVEIG